jgi:hypothetical protein
MKMRNDNGLLVIDQPDGKAQCVGCLFDFTGHGIFSPDGKVEISKDEADIHNRLLAEGEIDGLDQNCAIGQGGTFYWSPARGVTTWTGVKVADYTINGRSLTFRRAGKVYRGRIQKDADCFNFRRVA